MGEATFTDRNGKRRTVRTAAFRNTPIGTKNYVERQRISIPLHGTAPRGKNTIEIGGWPAGSAGVYGFVEARKLVIEY